MYGRLLSLARFTSNGYIAIPTSLSSSNNPPPQIKAASPSGPPAIQDNRCASHHTA